MATRIGVPMIFADTAAVTSFTSAISVILLFTTLVLGALNIRNKYEKGKDDETLKTLKESNEAFGTRREADAIIIDARDKEILTLKDQNEVYKNTVTQAPDINKLASQMVKQHKEMMGQIGKMTEELGNVAKAIGKNA